MKQILLVDDEDIWRSMLSDKILGELPVTVVKAGSGNEAIQLLESGTQVDFVVSDYSMKDGNGDDLLRYVSKKSPQLPFAIFSATINPHLPLRHSEFIGIFEKDQLDELLIALKKKLYGTKDA